MIKNISVCNLKMAKELEEIENEIFTTAWPSETIKQKINNKEFLKYLLYLISTYDFKKIFLICSYKSNFFFKKFHKKINRFNC